MRNLTTCLRRRAGWSGSPTSVSGPVTARAPHKPLLLLYSLGQFQRTGTTEVRYLEAEPALAHLLQDFGLPGRKSTPAYPFHHLQSDNLWSVATATGENPGSSPTQLRDTGAVGRLPPDFEAALRTDPALLVLAAHSLLDANFPESLHADICSQVGLDLQAAEAQTARQRASSRFIGRGRAAEVLRRGSDSASWLCSVH